MRFVVAQTGARRGYAVPAILERAGMLERFYTDICGNIGLGKVLAAGNSLPKIGSRLSRLSNRKLPFEIRSHTRTFARPYLKWLARAALSNEDDPERFRLDTRRTLEIGRAASRCGFGHATHLYSMLTEFAPLMVAAKERGLTVVSEVYILISTERILAEEQRDFSDWEPAPLDWDAVRRELLPENVLFTCVDWHLCPSDAVRDDLVSNWGVCTERTAVVPYGMDPRWLDLEPRPARGRLLFAGTAELRKGIHYLAMAAEKLVAKGQHYEFRIAGNVQATIARQSVCRHFNFLGRVPRDRIKDEFANADLFVLPSLAEGSAEVTYEALAAGVPVITTKAAGSVVRDGIEGRIVPERDSNALAAAIEELVEDRDKRDRMAAAARERAKEFTWEKYGGRLVAALRALGEAEG